MKNILLIISLLFFIGCSNKELYYMMKDIQKNKNKHEARESGIILENKHNKELTYEEYQEKISNK